MALLARVEEGARARLVDGRRIRAVLQQQPCRPHFAVLTRYSERRVAATVGHLEVDAARDEECSDGLIAAVARDEERARASCDLLLEGNAHVAENLHYAKVVVLHRRCETRATVNNLVKDAGAVAAATAACSREGFGLLHREQHIVNVAVKARRVAAQNELIAEDIVRSRFWSRAGVIRGWWRARLRHCHVVRSVVSSPLEGCHLQERQ